MGEGHPNRVVCKPAAHDDRPITTGPCSFDRIAGNAERLYDLLPDFVGDISLSHNPNASSASVNAVAGPIDRKGKHQGRRRKGLTAG